MHTRGHNITLDLRKSKHLMVLWGNRKRGKANKEKDQLKRDKKAKKMQTSSWNHNREAK